MSGVAWILFAVSTFLGAMVHTVGGFGFGIFVMSVYPYFLPSYTSGLTTSALLGIVIAAYLTIQRVRFIRWKLLLPLLLSSVVAGWLATRYLLRFSDAFLSVLLGIFLLLLSLFFFLFPNRVFIRPNALNGLLVGTMSGVINAAFAMGGPPLAIYLSSALETKDEYTANISCVFLATCVNTVIARCASGLVTPETLNLFLPGAAFVAVGIIVGKRIANRINRQTLQKTIYGFIAGSGIILLLKAI